MLIFQLSPGSSASLGPHRTRAGWEVCEEDEGLWLRFPPGEAPAAAALPCAARYRMDDRHRLIPLHGTLPVRPAPHGPWQSLDQFLTILPPSPVLPGRTMARLEMSLTRSSHEVPPAALLTDLPQLTGWADVASRLRLNRLQFAAAPGGRVLVRGTPLPATPGTPYYFEGPLALPCGWKIAPRLRPAWVAQALNLPANSVALLFPPAGIELLEQESFVPLTLAALRRTASAGAPS